MQASKPSPAASCRHKLPSTALPLPLYLALQRPASHFASEPNKAGSCSAQHDGDLQYTRWKTLTSCSHFNTWAAWPLQKQPCMACRLHLLMHCTNIKPLQCHARTTPTRLRPAATQRGTEDNLRHFGQLRGSAADIRLRWLQVIAHAPPAAEVRVQRPVVLLQPPVRRLRMPYAGAQLHSLIAEPLLG